MTYTIQINDEVREATAEEIAEIADLQNDLANKKEEAVAKAEARVALLQRLGITEEEAQLLL